jgi:phosphoribosyl 1,2-cyclic phosphate phosphodiesterase
VRSFNIAQRRSIPLYGSPAMTAFLREHFRYIWEPLQEGGGLPQIELRPVESPFEIAGMRVTPLPLLHGKLPIYGWRVGGIAYLTDVSRIPDATWPLLSGLDALVVDAVRYQPHDTHFHVAAAVEAARRIGARRTFLTHLNHDFLHAKLAAELPPGIEPAYDGLAIEAPGRVQQ